MRRESRAKTIGDLLSPLWVKQNGVALNGYTNNKLKFGGGMSSEVGQSAWYDKKWLWFAVP
jgi:hypothetical protein